MPVNKKSRVEQMKEKMSFLPEPEDLKAAVDGVDVDRDQLTIADTPVADPEPEQKPAAKKRKKAAPEPEKEKGRPCSFWLDAATKKQLKAYAAAKDASQSEIVNAALHAYFKRLKLSEEEQTIYNIMINK